MSVGVVILSAWLTGDSRSKRSALAAGPPAISHGAYQEPMSDVRWKDSMFAIGAPTTAALKRSVRQIAQAAR